MRAFFRNSVFVVSAVALVITVTATFNSDLSAIQQLATAALVAVYVLAFHAISSAIDRKHMMNETTDEFDVVKFLGFLALVAILSALFLNKHLAG